MDGHSADLLVGHLDAIDYTFAAASKLDYIVYYPRTDSGTRYGAFNEFNVYVATADAPMTARM